MRDFLNKYGDKIAVLFSLFGAIPVFYVIRTASGSISHAALIFAYIWAGVHVFAACLIYCNSVS